MYCHHVSHEIRSVRRREMLQGKKKGSGCYLPPSSSFFFCLFSSFSCSASQRDVSFSLFIASLDKKNGLAMLFVFMKRN
jgi:hypothetical protein